MQKSNKNVGKCEFTFFFTWDEILLFLFSRLDFENSNCCRSSLHFGLSLSSLSFSLSSSPSLAPSLSPSLAPYISPSLSHSSCSILFPIPVKYWQSVWGVYLFVFAREAWAGAATTNQKNVKKKKENLWKIRIFIFSEFAFFLLYYISLLTYIGKEEESTFHVPCHR